MIVKTVQRRKVTILDSDDEENAAPAPAAKPVAAAAGFPTAGKRKAQSSSSSSSSSSSDSDSDSSSSSSDNEALAVKQVRRARGRERPPGVALGGTRTRTDDATATLTSAGAALLQVKLKEGGLRDGGGKKRDKRTERKERRLAAGENGFANGNADKSAKAARKEAWRKRVGPAGVARPDSTVIELSDNENDGDTAEHAIEVRCRERGTLGRARCTAVCAGHDFGRASFAFVAVHNRENPNSNCPCRHAPRTRASWPSAFGRGVAAD